MKALSTLKNRIELLELTMELGDSPTRAAAALASDALVLAANLSMDEDDAVKPALEAFFAVRNGDDADAKRVAAAVLYEVSRPVLASALSEISARASETIQSRFDLLCAEE